MFFSYCPFYKANENWVDGWRGYHAFKSVSIYTSIFCKVVFFIICKANCYCNIFNRVFRKYFLEEAFPRRWVELLLVQKLSRVSQRNFYSIFQSLFFFYTDKSLVTNLAIVMYSQKAFVVNSDSETALSTYVHFFHATKVYSNWICLLFLCQGKTVYIFLNLGSNEIHLFITCTILKCICI